MSRKPSRKRTSCAPATEPSLPYRGACDLVLLFGDGEYRFELPLPQLLELERLTGAGIFPLYGRVMRGRFEGPGGSFGFAMDGQAGAKDLRETIRLALIGGGEAFIDGAVAKVDSHRALQLVDLYCPPVAPAEGAWNLAAAILDAVVHGRDRPEPSKADREAGAMLGAILAGKPGAGE